MVSFGKLLQEGRLLLKEAASPLVQAKKIPLSQRSPEDQVRYWVGTALSSLKAGMPSSASEGLGRALKISGYPEMNRVRPLVIKAQELAAGPNPRAADVYVEKAYKILKP